MYTPDHHFSFLDKWKLGVKLWKRSEGQTNASVEGAAYSFKRNLCGKTFINQDRFQNLEEE